MKTCGSNVYDEQKRGCCGVELHGQGNICDTCWLKFMVYDSPRAHAYQCAKELQSVLGCYEIEQAIDAAWEAFGHINPRRKKWRDLGRAVATTTFSTPRFDHDYD